MAVAVGKKLGPYEVLSPLGSGGMGEVYRARDPRLGREVAIKVLPSALAHDADRLRRFEQEARATGSLNHPNILAIYDLGESEGCPYIVSELLLGETLREKLREGTMPARKVSELGAQIARGLAAAHDQGIIHRDLKPENVFLTRDGRIKILDFGLAKLVQPDPAASVTNVPTVASHTEAGTVMGTVGYMSPEQVRGRVADPRSDLFALGAILYEMISGKRAFKGETPADTTTAILKEEPRDLTTTVRSVPPGLERIVRHCLEKNPEERFQSARDVAFGLESLSEAPSGATTAQVSRMRTGYRRWIAALVLLAAGVAAGWVAHSGRKMTAMTFQRLTFRRGTIYAARFAPDGRTVIYTAEWDGNPLQLFSAHGQQPQSGALELPKACLLAVSSTGELALIINPVVRPHEFCHGTLARAPMSGGAPREVLEGVEWADWGHDGESLAVVRSVGGKSRLEFPIGKLLYESSGWLSHPRISPDGTRVAFLEHPEWPDDRGWVAVVDLNGKKTRLTPEWISEDGVAWAPGARELWFAATDFGSTRSLRAVTLDGKVRLVAGTAGSLRLQDISADGRVLVTRDELRNGIQALAPGADRERDLTWMDWSLARDLSPDGKVLLFDEEGDGGGRLYSACLRNTDGSPPVRLGDGGARALSPDGKWAASVIPTTPARLVLLPTGAGAPRDVPIALEELSSMDFLPDNKRLLLCGNEPGQSARCFVQDMEGGKPVPVTPEGVVTWQGGSHTISPDGSSFVAVDPSGNVLVFPVAGGNGQPVPGATPGDIPIRWSADARSLFVYRRREFPTRVYRLDVQTGKKQLWKELLVPDPTGLASIGWIQVTPDGKAYAYTFSRALSELYLVDGAR